MDSERATNILGQPLEICSRSPMTGFQRDGQCRMPTGDVGRDGVCAQVNEAI